MILNISVPFFSFLFNRLLYHHNFISSCMASHRSFIFFPYLQNTFFFLPQNSLSTFSLNFSLSLNFFYILHSPLFHRDFFFHILSLLLLSLISFIWHFYDPQWNAKCSNIVRISIDVGRSALSHNRDGKDRKKNIFILTPSSIAKMCMNMNADGNNNNNKKTCIYHSR